jgi:hypothetical protein
VSVGLRPSRRRLPVRAGGGCCVRPRGDQPRANSVNVIVGNEDRCRCTRMLVDVLLSVRRIDAGELLCLCNSLCPPLDHDRVRAVAVEQDNLGLVRDVARLRRPRCAREVGGTPIPPKPDGNRVRPPYRRYGRNPDLTRGAESAVDVAPGNVSPGSRFIVQETSIGDGNFRTRSWRATAGKAPETRPSNWQELRLLSAGRACDVVDPARPYP